MKTMNSFYATAALISIAALAPLSQSHAATLFTNGPVVGSSLSVVRPVATTYGFGAQTVNSTSVAEDFVVTGGESWIISDLNFYAYQTNAANTFTFQNATWSIVSGSVSGPVVASGTTAVTNGGLLGYRVLSSALTGTTRAIFQLNADVTDFSLAPGNYFLRWSLSGSLASGPWQPPTSDGAVGNALQSLAAGPFNPFVDAGDGLGVSLPFAINGTAIPEPTSVLLLGLGFFTLFRRNRH